MFCPCALCSFWQPVPEQVQLTAAFTRATDTLITAMVTMIAVMTNPTGRIDLIDPPDPIDPIGPLIDLPDLIAPRTNPEEAWDDRVGVKSAPSSAPRLVISDTSRW